LYARRKSRAQDRGSIPASTATQALGIRQRLLREETTLSAV
jgi:hypothetical protein